MKIAILGAAGRMGRMLIASTIDNDAATLVGALERAGSECLGMDAGVLAGVASNGVLVSDDMDAVFDAADVVIDFTAPSATVVHAAQAHKTKTAMVIGTTGLAAADQSVIEAATGDIAIVQAANYSVGVNVLLGLAEKAATIMGDEFDIEILEMHHRHKVDAPSGTALALGDAVAAGRGIDLAQNSQRTRDGHTGARERGVIGFATLRGGDVAGDHSVVFAGDGERVELSHKASNRRVFSDGAVRAAVWAAGQQATGRVGLYSMRDVLGLS